MTSAPLTILRKDYLAIVDELIAEYQITVTRAVKFCAAKLLNTFERLAQWKQNAYSIPIGEALFWIPIFKKQIPQDTGQQTLPLDNLEPSKSPRSLYDELNGEHCRESISKAVQLLKELNLIDVQRNPYNGQDRTYWYKVFLEKLAIQPKPEPTIAPASPSIAPPAPPIAPPLPQDESDILQQVKALKIDLNSAVRKHMAKYGDRVPAAIDYVAEQQQQWAVRNPTGLFIKALNKGYKPSPNYQRSKPQQPTANSAYHDATKFWTFVDGANARFQREGLDALATWLNGLWQEQAHALVEYLLRECKWGYQLEVNREANTVEVAF
jgi:hypothetical protein